MSADSPVIPEILVALQGAKDATQAKGKADELSLAIKRSDIEALSTHSVLDTVAAWALSKSEQERANAAITFGRLIVNLGAGTEAVFLPYLESIFNLLNEKTAAIRTSAQSALNTFVKICPPEATRLVFVVLRACLKSLGGWRSQIGVLKALEGMVKEGATENVAAELGATIPLVEKAMHDTKAEVRLLANYLCRVSRLTSSLSLLSRSPLPPRRRASPSPARSTTPTSRSTLTSSSTPWPRPARSPPPSRLSRRRRLSLRLTPPSSLSWSRS